MHSNARELAALYGAAAMHPDNTPEKAAERAEKSSSQAIGEEWEILRRDLWKVLEVALCPWSELPTSSSFFAGGVDPGAGAGAGDMTRITFGVLKKKCDKARRKDPTITILKSWDYDEHEKLAVEGLRQREQAAAQSLKWARNNPDKIKATNGRNYLKTNAARNKLAAAILADHPCPCGESRIGCLQFHHLDPSKKERNITVHSNTWRKRLPEIQKCVVLCANCHQLHHYHGLKLPENMQPIDTRKYETLCLT